MKREKFYFDIIILLLVVAIVGSFVAMFNGNQKKDTYSVSVIVNNSNNSRWIAMRDGLEQAAKDYDITLDYVSTGEISGIEEEMQLINREIERGADGLIIQFSDSEIDMERMMTITSRADMVLIETDASPSELYTCVSPDNLAMGSEIALALKKDLGKNLSDKKIGILSGNQKQFSLQQRLNGFLNMFDGSEAQIEWIVEENPGTGITEFRYNQLTTPVDILVALGNGETEQAIDYAVSVSETRSVLLYGIGNSEKAVYYLDKGIVQTLVVPNEFNMGYESVEVLVNHMDFPLSEIEKREVNFLTADRENLYEEESERILFPIVQ